MVDLDALQQPVNFNPKPNFNFIVTELFEKLDAVKKDNLGQFTSLTAKKLYIIDEFIKNWRHYIGSNILPAARLIFPHRDGRLYYMRDVGFLRLIVKMYKIPKNTLDYKRIMDWKRNYHDYKSFTGDKKKIRTLPVIIAQLISERRDVQPPGDSVSIEELNEVLDNLGLDEVGKMEKQIKLLEPLFVRLNNSELRWVIQIILKESTIAPMETYFYSSWHPDAPAFSNVVNNLKAVFWSLTDPSERLKKDDLKVHLMYPFLPQLAAKPKHDYATLARQMGNNFFIEEKIDGDRMMMHMKRNPEDKNDIHFQYYTRRCRDYSLLYGNDLKFGALSKYLKNAFHEGVDSLVLDGEMVAWDYRRKMILPFGTLKASAVQEAVRHFTVDDAFADQSAWPFFIIYDIIYFNGVHISGTRLIDRKRALTKIIKEIPNRFEILKSPIGHTADDIEDAIKKAVSERSEGVLIKDINLKYMIAQRNKSWLKIKPEYLEQFGENLDLPVIGVIKGVKNAYMCALYDEEEQIYKSFCTVANGFSQMEYDEIARITSGKWVDFKTNPPPKQILFGSRKPDQWISPENSVVLEIKARSIDSSTLATYAVGTTLHNLYCRKLRDDKSYRECINLQTYREMKANNSRDVDKDQKVLNKNRKRKAEYQLTERAIILSMVESTSLLFEGFTFQILSGKLDRLTGKRLTDLEISRIVKQNGGSIVQGFDVNSCRPERHVCIGESYTIRARQMAKLGFDIIKPDWIISCIENGQIGPIESQFILKSSDKLLNNSMAYVDIYGDSYLLHVKEPLKDFCKHLNLGSPYPEANLSQLRHQFIKNELSVYEIDRPLMYLLFGVNVLPIRTTKTTDYELDGLKRRIIKYGGNIVESVSDSSLIVFARYENSDLVLWNEVKKQADVLSQEIANTFLKKGNLQKIPSIVKYSFIEDSILNGVLVDPQDHKI